jgi:hypothetical protein
MKKLLLIILPLLSLSFYSCGLLESEEDPMPSHQSASIDKIYSVNIDGSNLKFLSYGNDFITSFTGDTIFVRNNDSVYSVNLDGTNKHLLTPGTFSSFRLSSGKNKILLEPKNSSDHYFINTNGSGLTKLNVPSSVIYSWDLSPAADKILFSSPGGLWLINPDGSDLKLLKDTSGLISYNGVHFTWDGSSVLYHEIHNSASFSLTLFNLTSRVENRSFIEYYDFELSRTNKLLLSVPTGGTTYLDIYKNISLTVNQSHQSHLSFDESRFSYVYVESIFIYNLNSYAKTNIVDVNLPGNFIFNPRLSSDNSKIIFQADSTYYLTKK